MKRQLNKITGIIIITITILAVHVTFQTSAAKAQDEPYTLIPDWMSDIAQEWIKGTVTDDEFFVSLKTMLTELNYTTDKHVSDKYDANVTPPYPEQNTKPTRIWIEDRVRWWIEGRITDEQFLSAVQHLDESGRLKVSMLHTYTTISNLNGTENLKGLLPTEQEIDAITRTSKWRTVSVEYDIDKTDGVVDSVRVLSKDINRVYDPVFNKYKIPTMSMQITKITNHTSLDEYWLKYTNQTIQNTLEYSHMTGHMTDGTMCFFNYSDDGAATTCMRDHIMIQVIVFDMYNEHYAYKSPNIDLDATEPTTYIMDEIIRKINFATDKNVNASEALRHILQKKSIIQDGSNVTSSKINTTTISDTANIIKNKNTTAVTNTTNAIENKNTTTLHTENVFTYGIGNLLCIKDDFGTVTISGQYNNNDKPKNNLKIVISFVDWHDKSIGSTELLLEDIREFETKWFLGHVKWDRNFAHCQTVHHDIDE